MKCSDRRPNRHIGHILVDWCDAGNQHGFARREREREIVENAAKNPIREGMVGDGVSARVGHAVAKLHLRARRDHEPIDRPALFAATAFAAQSIVAARRHALFESNPRLGIVEEDRRVVWNRVRGVAGEGQAVRRNGIVDTGCGPQTVLRISRAIQHQDIAVVVKYGLKIETVSRPAEMVGIIPLEHDAVAATALRIRAGAEILHIAAAV